MLFLLNLQAFVRWFVIWSGLGSLSETGLSARSHLRLVRSRRWQSRWWRRVIFPRATSLPQKTRSVALQEGLYQLNREGLYRLTSSGMSLVSRSFVRSDETKP